MILRQANQKITASSFDPEKTYTICHEAAKYLMLSDAFIIAIINKVEEEIHGVYQSDKDEQTPPIRYPSGQGLSVNIFKT
jgi:hypothetical protein